MPFTKGNSGNPLGRPKGSLNHSTKEARELLSSALDTNKIKEMLERIEELYRVYKRYIQTTSILYSKSQAN